MNDIQELFRQLANESKSVPFATRLEPTTRQMLGKLAQSYEISMNEVVVRLIQQGYVDYIEGGECLGLSKFS